MNSWWSFGRLCLYVPCELRRFHKLGTENNVAQNTLWLLCAFASYGGKTKFQMLFKILAFLSILGIETKVSLY